MRLAFVGYGSIAEAHARAFREIPGCSVEWVVGREPAATAEFADRWGISHRTLSLEEALAGEVDGVVITSPSDMHPAQTIASLRAGKHVLVEIPVSTDLAGAEAVAAAGRETGLRVQVCHTQRYYPALVELRRRLAGGELTPHHLVCQWYFLRRENVNWTGRRRSWTDNLLWHHGCHVVDAALWLLGGPAEEVRAQFGPPHPELRIPLDLDLQFRVGASLVSISMSYNSPWPRHEYFLIAEERSVAYRDRQLWAPEGVLLAPAEPDRSILEQDREWIAAIREQRAPAVAPETVLPAMRALHAAEQAAGVPFSVPETGEPRS
jgi:2-hydroxy-4-carboxymuconate semialdehyde hemiacetal dehydrogenase